MKKLFLLSILLFIGQILHAQLTANFTIQTPSGCSPLATTFTDVSTGGATNWLWDFGNGNTSTLQSPGAIYSTPGVYIVSLTVSNASANHTAYDTIRVYNDPIIDFTASDTLGCSILTTQFTNLSTTQTGIASVHWDFGDGNTSTAINPTHNFNTGTYSVTLFVTDISGCSAQSTKTNYIQAINAPLAQFTANITQSCTIPASINFTNTTTNSAGATYFWDFGDGNTSTQQHPSHTYTSFGNYTVFLVASNTNCNDTFEIVNYININPQNADFSSNNTNACIGDSIQFTDNSTLISTSWLWDFGDGNTSTLQNPIHSYSSAGSYTVSLTSNIGTNCTDTEIQNNYITISNPTINLSASSTDTCAVPFTVQFSPTGPSSGASYLWDFGDGNTSTLANPNHTYTNTDSFTVSLTITSSAGCTTDTAINNMININPPNASFIVDSMFGCAPMNINLIDTSNSAIGIANWYWNFDDGNISTQQNPSHTFVDTGSYYISLVVEDSLGCRDTLQPSSPINVGQQFDVAFDATPKTSCKIEAIEFTNLTDTLNVSNVFWLWEFGDGGTSIEFSPSYEYGDTGVFDVNLNITHNGCRSSTDSIEMITIYPPIALFSFNADCSNPTNYNFTNNSIGAETWTWNIDGASYNTENTSHNFAGEGTYSTLLIVENLTYGCIDSIQQNITIQLPTYGFSTSDTLGCIPFTVQFTDTSNLSTSWLWDFGDGTTSTQQNPSHTYDSLGTFTVQLIVSNSLNCFDTITKINHIRTMGSNVNFSVIDSNSCSYSTTSFIDSSISFSGLINQWLWSFGDGNTSTLQNPIHTYTTADTFDVSLQITDTSNCISQLTIPQMIYVANPMASFSVAPLHCIDTDIAFSNTSSSANSTINSWRWNFGDGDTSTLQNPTHSYSSAGMFDVSLAVVDNNGCTDTITTTNAIQIDTLVADFAADSTIGNCTGFVANFQNLSNNNPTTFHWNFGNGITSSLENPSTIYSNIGTFDVQLIVSNPAGCIDTIVKSDYITINGPAGTLSSSIDSGCVNLDVTFEVTNTNADNIIWDFGDGVISNSNTFQTTHTYTTVSTFNPLVILSDSNNCQISYFFDPVYTSSLQSNFSYNTNYLCTPDTIQFINASTSSHPIQSLLWNFGDGNTSTQQHPSHHYTTDGIFDVSLIVENDFCADTMTINNAIVPDSSTNATFGYTLPPLLCLPAEVSFTDSSTADSSIVDWFWTFGDGDTSTLQNPTHIYDSVGIFDVSLQITTNMGCVSQITMPQIIQTFPNPSASFTVDTLHCVHTDVPFTNTSTPNNIATWQWTFGDGNTSTLQNPTHSYNYAGVFDVSLLVIDNNDCSDSISVANIIQIDTLVAEFTADNPTGDCVGHTINFQDLSYPNPTTFNWTFGTGDTSTLQNPSIVFPNLGSFDAELIVSNLAGCIDTMLKPNYITINGPVGTLSTSVDSGCINLDVTFNITNSNAQSIAWDFDDGTTLNNSNFQATHTYTTVGTFNPSVVLTDSNNCQITYPFSSIYTADLQSNFGFDTNYICTPNHVQFTDLSISSHPIQSWLWTFGDGNTSTLQNPNHNYITDGVFDVSLVVDNNYCVKTFNVNNAIVSDSSTNALFSFVLPDYPCPSAQISFTDLSTADSTITTWQWNFGNGQTDSTNTPNTITYDTAGVYTISLAIETEKGCRSVFEQTITINPVTLLDLDFDSIALCFGEDTLFNAIELGDTVSFVWLPDNNLSCSDCPNPTILAQQNIPYQITATNQFGCTDTDSLTIVSNPLPELSVSPAQRVLVGTEVELKAVVYNIPNTTFNWSPTENVECSDCPIASYTATENTLFTATATSPFGCTDTASTQVTVFDICSEEYLFFPNIFTPNNDGNYDVFKPTLRYGLKAEINYFRIFDRWGKLLFETDDISNGWDGKANGRNMNNGVYIYTLEYICPDGTENVIKGNVTLMR